ncbi:hypothetical protein [Janibacter indicus]|uniref:Uncharacterized protein n=1 Tax=Janibacter indicus TaxID=857417 RepID=A0A1W1ZQ03_9MICO|nr:hypothetical protein [Janibacter indicus]SMC50484.1 hypothetical protein SAMN06296429_104148 [Janibacter indicus]
MGDDSTQGAEPLGRRSVVKGAAWTAPIVTLGVAAPATAASAQPITPDASWSCRPHKEGWTYTVRLTLSNGLRCGVNVSIRTFQVRINGRTVVSGGGTVFVSAGKSSTLTFAGGTTNARGQGALTLTYSYRDCGGATRAETRNLTLSPLGHCQGAHGADPDKSSVATESTTPSSAPAPEADVVTPTPAPSTPAASQPATDPQLTTQPTTTTAAPTH